VLYEALAHGLGGSPLLLAAYAMGLLAVPITGFYTIRMLALTFHGEPRTEVARDPHGVRWNVTGPLVVLGVLAAVAGFVNMVPVKKLTGAKVDYLHQYLDAGEAAGEPFAALSAHHYGDVLHEVGYAAATPLGEAGTVLASAALSLGLAVLGAGMAWRLYGVSRPARHAEGLPGYDVIANNYYQDEYQVWLAEGLTLPLARAADLFDRGVVDGAVNGASSVSLFLGRRMRRLQTGVVTDYAALVALGFLTLLLAIAAVGGWL